MRTIIHSMLEPTCDRHHKLPAQQAQTGEKAGCGTWTHWLAPVLTQASRGVQIQTSVATRQCQSFQCVSGHSKSVEDSQLMSLWVWALGHFFRCPILTNRPSSYPKHRRGGFRSTKSWKCEGMDLVFLDDPLSTYIVLKISIFLVAPITDILSLSHSSEVIMNSLFFRTRATTKEPEPESPEEDDIDIRTILPPAPVIHFRRHQSNSVENHVYITEEAVPLEVKKIISLVESEESLNVLDSLILLRKAKELCKYNHDRLNNCIVSCYLGVMYYKTGMLEQSLNELITADAGLSQQVNAKKLAVQDSSVEIEQYLVLFTVSKWQKLRARIHIQICILLSENERHSLALNYAQSGCQLFYQVALNYSLILGKALIQTSLLTDRMSEGKSRHSTPGYNLLPILSKLLQITEDLRNQFISKAKNQIYTAQQSVLSRLNLCGGQLKIEQFSLEVMTSDWILSNKILNQIQMEILTKSDYSDSIRDITPRDVGEIIAYLSVSFYCLSTESRFTQKQEHIFSTGNILESESWLGRSLEVAYTFLPLESPILGQIYSVHEKFYGLGNQPIPEDGQFDGYVKFLRQIRKISSIYNKKATLICSPVLIRINPYSKLPTEKVSRQQSHHTKLKSLTIDLSRSVPKNHPKRNGNSLDKIYKKNGRRLTHIKGSSSLEDKIQFSHTTRQHSLSTDFTLSRLEPKKKRQANIEVKNNLNFYLTHNTQSFDDKFLSPSFGAMKQLQTGTRKTILRMVPGGFKDSTSRRNVYHSKRKSAINNQTNLLKF